MTTINQNLLIGYSNLANGMTVTATSSQTGYPASNLADPRIVSAKHRGNAAALTSFNHDVDLATTYTFEMVGLLGTNFSDTATRRIYGDNNSSTFASAEVDSTSGDVFNVSLAPLITDTPAHGRHLLWITDTVTAVRYVRIQVTDASNTDNYLQSGVYWVSKVWQPAVPMTSWTTPDALTGVPGLERYIRRHQCNFQNLTEAECRQMHSLIRALKRTGRLVVVPRPQSASSWIEHAIYCTIVDAFPVAPISQGLTEWQLQVTFEEVLD